MIRSKRTKPRPGRLAKYEIPELRQACWERDSRCKHCRFHTIFDAPHTWMLSFHMSHIKAKRMGGDSLENVETLCGDCHRKSHSFGPSMTKPVPPKETHEAH